MGSRTRVFDEESIAAVLYKYIHKAGLYPALANQLNINIHNINNNNFNNIFNIFSMCACVSASKANCVVFSVGINMSSNKNSASHGLNTSSSSWSSSSSSNSSSAASGGMLSGWSFFSNSNSTSNSNSQSSAHHMKHMNVWMPQTM